MGRLRAGGIHGGWGWLIAMLAAAALGLLLSRGSAAAGGDALRDLSGEYHGRQSGLGIVAETADPLAEAETSIAFTMTLTQEKHLLSGAIVQSGLTQTIAGVVQERSVFLVRESAPRQYWVGERTNSGLGGRWFSGAGNGEWTATQAEQRAGLALASGFIPSEVAQGAERRALYVLTLEYAGLPDTLAVQVPGLHELLAGVLVFVHGATPGGDLGSGMSLTGLATNGAVQIIVTGSVASLAAGTYALEAVAETGGARATTSATLRIGATRDDDRNHHGDEEGEKANNGRALGHDKTPPGHAISALAHALKDLRAAIRESFEGDRAGSLVDLVEHGLAGTAAGSDERVADAIGTLIDALERMEGEAPDRAHGLLEKDRAILRELDAP